MLNLLSQDPTRKVNIALQVCLLMLVSSQLISIWIVAKHTTGAAVVILKSTPSVMVSVNGFLQDVVQFISMFRRADITNYVTAKCQPMHHSAMELINKLLSGLRRTTVAFGVSTVLLHSGLQASTGDLHSTSEQHTFYLKTNSKIQCLN